jgi:hypothetical protein
MWPEFKIVCDEARHTNSKAISEANHSTQTQDARSKALVCARSLAGLWVRIPAGSVVCCQVEVSLAG